ncbi:MAG: AAA domain-containing protein [Prolixibacteraceae bacterium]
MELTKNLLTELQNRLKVGNRRGVHLNAIPGRSRYKFDLQRLSYLNKDLPNNFINALLTEQPLRFNISWNENVPDLNSLFEDDQTELVKITKSFENLINQTQSIESEKGINTFGFGFPLLIRKDQADDKLTVAPILIWSLRIKRTKDFNTWMIYRNEDDPIYINEVLINHLQNDSGAEISQVSSEMLEDGLIDREELLDICVDLIKSVNSTTDENIREIFKSKLNNIKKIPERAHYEKLPLASNNSFIEFGGIFSIFEVQKQNIIGDYDHLLELEGMEIALDDLEKHFFQPISSVETDPSQQGILHALESKRNILIQGPPGTGKSQSLTAILINALENNKKTIVVCEKQTALEVLHNALVDKALGNHCIMIKDIIKDRKVVVDSVRDRNDNLNDARAYRHVNLKESLDNHIEISRRLIESINTKHKKLGEILFENNNWSNAVGLLLLELKKSVDEYKIEFESSLFQYNSKEFHEYLNVLDKGQKLYDEYAPVKQFSFINPDKFNGDNLYQLEQKFKDDFTFYQNELAGDSSELRKLINYHKYDPYFFKLSKTKSPFYRLTSLFSKRKQKTIADQKIVLELCQNLSTRMVNDGWAKSNLNHTKLEPFIESVRNLLTAKDNYLSNENDLFAIEYNWYNFYKNLSKSNQLLLSHFYNKKSWKNVFILNYLNGLLLTHASVDLPVNDADHLELKQSLSEIGKEQINYINEYWYAQQIGATKLFNQSNSGISLENLYNKRGSKRYKRLSLRQIVRKAPDLFTSFFPIVLTTPDVCSNLFKGMNQYFDIVLFDEASQLRIEDNLPALLKGKQIVIAGDEHQMPPSNYFSKIFDGTIDDEVEMDEEEEIVINTDNILLSCESLLDFATELNFEKRYLDFHYRSRHPYLIDFSNHAFYSKRLKPLPNNFEYNPISYIQVDGTFSDHTNEIEAEAVLNIIDKNIHKLSSGEYPSVGIATFNIAQRNLIISKINDRRKFERFADFNQKIIELEENGLFVKNLENIQGDERDVIILSTTYGINKDGKFAQRFGPINHKKGYKLLNVIITRAKYKVYVCSSIPESVFLGFKDHLNTEGENNRKAVFFAYLAYAKAVSKDNNDQRQAVLNALAENITERSSIDNSNADLESPFEEEVYQVLTEHFDEEKIIPQLQFAGFRIDMVYDPQTKGLPKIAIECDGAAYHSSSEAYLHDMHRQKILESHGFVFHRIWSTNWWRNPQRETTALIEFIRSVENQAPEFVYDDYNPAEAMTDEYRTPERKAEVAVVMNTVELEETFELDDLKEPTQLTFYPEVIKLNSKVKVKYLNNNKDIKIQLVETPNDKYEKVNDLQRIYYKSPLAVSILGKSVGETARVGELDNYVEILEILR